MKKLVVIFCLLIFHSYVIAEDVCETIIPIPLATKVAGKYKNYRLAKSTDQESSEDKEWNKRFYKKDICTTVAVGNFNSDNEEDYVFYIVEQKSLSPKLIAASSFRGLLKNSDSALLI